MELKVGAYDSPRWSSEYTDCSLPVTLDTYSKCSFGCVYCFSQFQRGIGSTAKYYYGKESVSCVNVETIKKIFTGEKPSRFWDYVKTKRPIQWGGLSDQFDGYEKRYGKTYELMKFFKEINYPISFSTKSTWVFKDPKYVELFRGQDNWNVKFSIITLDEQKARIIEKGCPSPKARLEAMKIYSGLNKGGATLRLRPLIIGVSDDYEELIRAAAGAGATAVSTEFFCLETRSKNARENYRTLSKVCGYDIVKFYRKYSTQNGYLRLNRGIKNKYIHHMKDICDELGLRFYVSDAHFKELCHNSCCCGLPEDWDYSKGNFSAALQLCRKNGRVTFSEIESDMYFYDTFKWIQADGLNSSSTNLRAKFEGMTMRDVLRYYWNNPNSGKSPYGQFGGIMYPNGYDEEGNVIYLYNYDIDENK